LNGSVLTNEAKKTRGVSRLARVQLIFPFPTLPTAGGALASARALISSQKDGPSPRAQGGKREYLRGPNPRRAVAARGGVTAARDRKAAGQESYFEALVRRFPRPQGRAAANESAGKEEVRKGRLFGWRSKALKGNPGAVSA